MPSSAWKKDVCSRSEEHTSELQSLTNLVCLLLLEKKNEVSDPALRITTQRRNIASEDHSAIHFAVLSRPKIPSGPDSQRKTEFFLQRGRPRKSPPFQTRRETH